jgi:hypothetical protein
MQLNLAFKIRGRFRDGRTVLEHVRTPEPPVTNRRDRFLHFTLVHDTPHPPPQAPICSEIIAYSLGPCTNLPQPRCRVILS